MLHPALESVIIKLKQVGTLTVPRDCWAVSHTTALEERNGSSPILYIVHTFGELEVFGDTGCFNDPPQRTAAIMAVYDTVLIKLEKDHFLDMEIKSHGKTL